MPRRNRRHRRPRRLRGGVRHRRSAEAVGRRRLRAQRHAQYVLARRLARRSVRRVWLGTQARLIFDRPCALAEAPDFLRDAVADLASRLGGTAHQMFTAAGSPEVKDAAGRHLCRHRWRIRLGGRELALSLSAHKQMGGSRMFVCQNCFLLVACGKHYISVPLDVRVVPPNMRHLMEQWDNNLDATYSPTRHNIQFHGTQVPSIGLYVLTNMPYTKLN